MISSLGYHTLAIYRTLTKRDARAIYNTFKDFRDRNPHAIFIESPDDSDEAKKEHMRKNTNEDNNRWLQRKPPQIHKIRYLNYTGIEWALKFDDVSFSRGNRDRHEEARPCSIKAIINPKVLAGIMDYVTAADVSYLDKVRENFNREVEKISPMIGAFDRFLLNRVDYCVNFDLKELGINTDPDKMMLLLKKGYHPSNLKERMKYSESSRRMKPGENLYLTNNSIHVNCYGKYDELHEKFPKCPNIQDAKNVVRFEIQCNYPKIYLMSKEMGRKLTSFEIIREMLKDQVSGGTIRRYYNQIIGTGAYFTLEQAKIEVSKHQFHLNKTYRLIDALELVNRCRGISKAMETLWGKEREDFKRSLKELESINVNPVTIPREWGIKRIPNLLTAYYDLMNKQRLAEDYERFKAEAFNEFENERLSRKKKKG